MNRKTRMIVIAVAAAALAPAAHAAPPPGWVSVDDDQGIAWLVPQPTDSACTAGSGWITVTDDLGMQWLEQTGAAGSCPSSNNAQQQPAKVAVKKQHKSYLFFTTENAPSQNKIARRNAQ